MCCSVMSMTEPLHNQVGWCCLPRAAKYGDTVLAEPEAYTTDSAACAALVRPGLLSELLVGRAAQVLEGAHHINLGERREVHLVDCAEHPQHVAYATDFSELDGLAHFVGWFYSGGTLPVRKFACDKGPWVRKYH